MNESIFFSQQIAIELLRIKAVVISPKNPFSLSSGMRCPMYCDNRLTLSYPKLRTMITDAFEQEVRRRDMIPDTIVAVATAGIAHAAFLAQRLEVPLVYVRSKHKGYGRQKQIEGVLKPGDRTLVVEDLVMSGESSLRVVDVVHGVTGRLPEAVLSIFTYDIPGVRLEFTKAGSPLVSISDLGVLLHGALAFNLLTESELDALRSFQNDPDAWSDRFKAMEAAAKEGA